MRKINSKSVLLNEGYTVFCICDIMQARFGDSFMDGCDTAWNTAIAMAEEFYDSEYDVTTKSEYECLEDFCRDQGESWIKERKQNDNRN